MKIYINSVVSVLGRKNIFKGDKHVIHNLRSSIAACCQRLKNRSDGIEDCRAGTKLDIGKTYG